MPRHPRQFKISHVVVFGIYYGHTCLIYGQRVRRENNNFGQISSTPVALNTHYRFQGLIAMWINNPRQADY